MKIIIFSCYSDEIYQPVPLATSWRLLPNDSHDVRVAIRHRSFHPIMLTKKKHMKSNCFRSGENDDHSTVNFMFFFLPNWGSYSFIVSIFRVQRSRILAKLRFGKVTQEIGKVIQMLFNSRSMNLLESFARRGAVSAVPENWNKYSWCEF